MGVKSWPIGTRRARWEHWPRDERNRYRIYRRGKGPAEVVATTPTKEGIGMALAQLHDEGEFEDCRVGVLDTLAERDGWIVNPY